jgi:hypothetical protein
MSERFLIRHRLQYPPRRQINPTHVSGFRFSTKKERTRRKSADFEGKSVVLGSILYTEWFLANTHTKNSNLAIFPAK